MSCNTLYNELYEQMNNCYQTYHSYNTSYYLKTRCCMFRKYNAFKHKTNINIAMLFKLVTIIFLKNNALQFTL